MFWGDKVESVKMAGNASRGGGDPKEDDMIPPSYQ
jgi:hypothetical protein